VRDALDRHEGDVLLFRVERSRALLAKTPDLIELAGSVGVPEAKRGTSWDDVIRQTRVPRRSGRIDLLRRSARAISTRSAGDTSPRSTSTSVVSYRELVRSFAKRTSSAPNKGSSPSPAPYANDPCRRLGEAFASARDRQHGHRLAVDVEFTQSVAADVAGSLHGAVDVVLRAASRALAAIAPSSWTPINTTPPSALENATAVFCNCSIDVPRLNSTCWLSPGNAARNSARLIVSSAAAEDCG
jgi:hypothetical protein